MNDFLRKRSISLSGHRTSIALEPEFWEGLEQMAHQAGLPLATFITGLDRNRLPNQPLSSSLRLAVLRHALAGTSTGTPKRELKRKKRAAEAAGE